MEVKAIERPDVTSGGDTFNVFTGGNDLYSTREMRREKGSFSGKDLRCIRCDYLLN
jgi:hypothetical protein